MSKVLVVGGGAAGMFAAIFAAYNGNEVHIFEKNEKLGKKLFITGKGRCNLTNACDMEELFESIVSNSKFMYSSLYGYTNQDVIDFFESLGVATKTERGNRVYPASDHSSDVIRGLERELKRLGVRVHLHTTVKQVATSGKTGKETKSCNVTEDDCKEISALKFSHICLEDGRKIYGDTCIIATGGISYPSTGSTGDGYRFARETGHKVTELFPALVPMEVEEWYAKELQGLSLRNVTCTVLDGKKKLYEDFGEMLFTHFGVSGPLILSAASFVGPTLNKKELTLSIDLKPALTEEQLDQRILRDFEENRNKQFKNAITKLFPAKLAPIMVELSGIDPEKPVNRISREERLQFAGLIKHFTMTLTGLRGYNEAIITKGGVSVRDVQPGTMESKKVPGLYFVGEVLDLDALTGGFNLQIAWSTGHAAGSSIF